MSPRGGKPCRPCASTLNGASELTNAYYRNRANKVALASGIDYSYTGFMTFLAGKSDLESLKEHSQCGFLASNTLMQYQSACV